MFMKQSDEVYPCELNAIEKKSIQQYRYWPKLLCYPWYVRTTDIQIHNSVAHELPEFFFLFAVHVKGIFSESAVLS